MAEERSPISSIPVANLRKIQKATMNYTWRGVMCNKNPFDLALYPKLIWDQKPATIIEIGSKLGGSALFFDDICIRFGIKTRIVSIDIDQRAIIRRKNVQFFQGDGRNLGEVLTPDFIAELPHPWLVVEDADHHYLTTMAVLEFMAPLLARGEYLCIEDGICDSFGNEGRYGGGPNLAVKEFVAARPDVYEIDSDWCDYFGYNVTWNTNGYLKRL